jgi:hypothetical protein
MLVININEYMMNYTEKDNKNIRKRIESENP